MIFLLVLFYVFFPLVIIYLTKKSSWLNKLGAVVLAYMVGVFLGNIGLLPTMSEELRNLLGGKAFLPEGQLTEYMRQGILTEADLLPNRIAHLQDILMTITIPLALPLLLFTLDVKRWLHMARRAMIAMVLGIVSLLIVAIIGFFLLKNHIPDAWKVAGMLVGIYTGGTPNLAAIATALEVDPGVFILVNTYEIVTGFGFLIFLMTVAQSLLNRFMPPFKSALAQEHLDEIEANSEEFEIRLTRESSVQMAKALALSIAIFAIGGGLSLVVAPSVQMVTVILTITTLGVVGSLVPAINRLKHSFSLGMYLILIFSLLVATMADLTALFNIDFFHLFLFVALGVFGTMVFHVILCWLFKIDTDTTIIAISALSFSPPFVPVVASALKNKEVIISGLAVGTLGYIFGNYLGVTLAFFLKAFV
ncbi:DUF819 family protein [Mangrovibacterium diazotrophicum]|uniref:Putative membrane protein n=1 Tax=Mangrovibacterium diazotrophicum TaxID=1261403 RepID=A0A419VWH9_9BACT|nr:DUF819 family protein [Mangrovibacterium diazotrophicum]RKD86517.1 putative membrane protein [Mangrovibacterium diazotrophicum]